MFDRRQESAAVYTGTGYSGDAGCSCEDGDHEVSSANYANWLSECEVPKLFVNAEPGSILTGAARAFARSFKNQTEVTVAGSHFIQEDSPAEIGAALATFVAGLRG